MLDKYLDLVGPVGFSTVLSGGASLSESLQKTRFSGLSVLTSGAVPPNPSELLGSLAAKKLLSELRAQFDYVIVDSTPLLAVTDAALLAAGADGVFIMARFGQTKREQLAHAVGNLQSVGARLLGAVFTMVPTRGSAAYSYRYSYSYGYYGNDTANRASRREPLAESGVVQSPLPNTVAAQAGGRKRRNEASG
jgi:receptor protein-tyrosine kinase